MMSDGLQTQPTLSRIESRFYARLRAWADCGDSLRFIWQVLNSRPAVEGPEPQLWLVPSATSDGASYLVDTGARACVCDGFHFRHTCPHLAVADRAACLRVQFSAACGDWEG